MSATASECGSCFFFFQAEDGIRDADVTGVQTCALPIYRGTVPPVSQAARPPAADPEPGQPPADRAAAPLPRGAGGRPGRPVALDQLHRGGVWDHGMTRRTLHAPRCPRLQRELRGTCNVRRVT